VKRTTLTEVSAAPTRPPSAAALASSVRELLQACEVEIGMHANLVAAGRSYARLWIAWSESRI